MDVALSVIAKTFLIGFTKNKILEFIGPGVGNLSVEYRMGIDVMMTESAALSSIWATDKAVYEWLSEHGRETDYAPLAPAGVTCYDGCIEVDLSQVECMMALPYHPSNAIPIREFKADPAKYLAEVEAEGNKIKDGRGKPFHIVDKLKADGLHIDQALVSGCAGGMFENLSAMADILDGCALPGNGSFLGINPASQPVYLDIMRQGIADTLTLAGAVIRGAMCGPCFGVSDIPADNQLSIRHVTRNYPNREGSKPGGGQMAATILMDARSIAATVRSGGVLTAADELDVTYTPRRHHFDPTIYQNQVYDNAGKPDESVEMRMGPNIASWPEVYPYKKHLLLQVAGAYQGSVTTDELVPSGDATAYRSNPEKSQNIPSSPVTPAIVPEQKQSGQMPLLSVPGSCRRIPLWRAQSAKSLRGWAASRRKSPMAALSHAMPSVTAPPASSPQAIRRCWAGTQIWPVNIPPSVTVPTSLTGASYP